MFVTIERRQLRRDDFVAAGLRLAVRVGDTGHVGHAQDFAENAEHAAGVVPAAERNVSRAVGANAHSHGLDQQIGEVLAKLVR